MVWTRNFQKQQMKERKNQIFVRSRMEIGFLLLHLLLFMTELGMLTQNKLTKQHSLSIQIFCSAALPHFLIYLSFLCPLRCQTFSHHPSFKISLNDASKQHRRVHGNNIWFAMTQLARESIFSLKQALDESVAITSSWKRWILCDASSQVNKEVLKHHLNVHHIY